MNEELTRWTVLIAEDPRSDRSEAMNRALERLEAELQDRNFRIIRAKTYCDAMPVVENDMDLDAILLCTDMHEEPAEEKKGECLLNHIRRRQGKVPVFLLADRADTIEHLTPEIMELGNEFIWIFEDSPAFIAGRIEAAAARFRTTLLPPLMKAVWKYNEENHEYSWAAPGHQGGVGFTKSAAGRKFYDFYGENLFRTDTGIERSSIGSLLDHTGAFQASERLAARTFGADESYSVVVGTSGSNRTVMQACLTERDFALCDRNCHKSIEQGLILTGARPVYMIPTRNRYGIIGPILRREMMPETVCRKLAASPWKLSSSKIAYSVVTNCTYDGLCYNAEKAERELALSTDRIHFDEAWYAYARFNPMYKDHYAMRCCKRSHSGATVFATHSTHKLLNALSQASYIHIRKGRNYPEFDRFNQAYMIHATTSPLYAICASNDIAGAMMAESGEALTEEVIAEAVDFRQALARIHRQAEKENSWFFKPWNAEKVYDSRTKQDHCFADAPRDLLIHSQDPWRLREGDVWHGFSGLEENWVMLDPVKVSILSPGMGDDGKILPHGVPAALVSAYLYREGIVPTRTTDFQIMFLFSMGITKGKWGTLLNALLNFRRLCESNAPLQDLFPDLIRQYGKVYSSMGVRDLSDKMFEYIRENTPGELLNKAFDTLPRQVLTPRQAYEKIVRNEVELVSADRLANRVTANAVIPYPPGIPLLISGECFGDESSPHIRYLRSLETWDREFPGFEHETEGAKAVDGSYCVLCVKGI